MGHFKLSGTKRSPNKVNGSDGLIETLKASIKMHYLYQRNKKCHLAELTSDSWSAYKTSCKYLTCRHRQLVQQLGENAGYDTRLEIVIVNIVVIVCFVGFVIAIFIVL